jgi:hypothetical protein
LIENTCNTIDIVAINLSTSGTATTIMERLTNIPRILMAARNNLRSTSTYVVSLKFFAHREVMKRARGPEKMRNESRIVAKRASDSIALLSW